MQDIIKRLRELERQFKAAETVGTRSAMGGHIVGQLPQLLDRLEKLEAVVEAAQRPRIAHDYTEKLEAALAALGEK